MRALTEALYEGTRCCRPFDDLAPQKRGVAIPRGPFFASWHSPAVPPHAASMPLPKRKAGYVGLPRAQRGALDIDEHNKTALYEVTSCIKT